ncbi:MAG: GspE/PulE family protein [Patescibacteria group bacterium]|nr:GspE/PulE family protein [Patescibacteria group bacterium]
MSDNIEELIKSSRGEEVGEESSEAKFAKKQGEIKIKEIERQTNERAQAAGLPYIDLFGFPISPEAIALISEADAARLRVICFFYDGANVRIGVIDPSVEEIKAIADKIAKDYHVTVALYVISAHSFDYALKIYKTLPKITRQTRGVEITEAELEKFKAYIEDYRSLGRKINEVNTTDVIALILATALKMDSSDVHVEAEEKGIAVRIRVDGVLYEAATIEKEKWKQIISRLKLLAKVKINIIDKPQDGRFTIFLSNEKIEVRVSFLPTNFGESVVVRLLRPGSISLSFEALGLRPKAWEILEKEISKPNGLVLTTGPTGSGKTTTLYAILQKINKPGAKIITLEDPIEYQLEGINQSQVDPSKGYTFASGLRSILRQDPDVIMLGEIRDLETAETAIQAALTGHLVFSTLHTNDAAGVLPRLIDIGVKPYFMTPSINCVVGQRLVRRLCPQCKQEHVLTEEEKEKVEKIMAVVSSKSGEDVPTTLPKMFKAGAGCPACNGIGYKGRVGIYELFTMTESIKQLATDNAPAFKILEQAIEDGMLTMLQDGVFKVFDGITSLEEVYRVIGKTDYIDALYDIVISKTFGHGIKVIAADIARAEEIAADSATMNDKAGKIPPREMLNVVMAIALKDEAGDVHIEPAENDVKIRFRIDGILHDIFTLSKEHYLPLLSQVKISAGFPTNVKKATWDGRFGIFLKNKKIDCRISIISGGYGETVVIRILSSQAEELDLEKLGMRPYALDPVKRSMAKTKGIIINTGPTGSGKTTTLYAILNALNKSDVKIITVEDPIEYHLEGVMQTQIDPEQGYTFVAAMRSLLRQNPNIMMIGEIRDEETAKVAIEASLTGHLVLSTIHANTAATAISRFAGLGVGAQMLASAVECTIGQRLVRKNCQYCKAEVKLSDEQMTEVKKIIDSISPLAKIKIPKTLKFYQGKGCDKCNGLGYKGRLGIYETIEMIPEMQKKIQEANVTAFDIEQEAIKSGTVTMMQDGILKALDGETSVEEVFRVVK